MSWPFRPQQFPGGCPAHRSTSRLSLLGEDLADESLESLCQGRVRNVAPCTGSNLPAAKRPPVGTSTLCNSFTTEDLPMAGISHTPAPASAVAVAHDTVEGREQGLNLWFPPRTTSPGSAIGPTCHACPTEADRSVRRIPGPRGSPEDRPSNSPLRSDSAPQVVLARSFMTSAEIDFWQPLHPFHLGASAAFAMWQWIHSIGSVAVKGSAPVSIS